MKLKLLLMTLVVFLPLSSFVMNADEQNKSGICIQYNKLCRYLPFDLYVDTMISGRTARLKCREYGYYKVIVRAYDNGVLVDTNRLEVLCLPS